MPALTDFAPSVTFDENTVNATPQLLDSDVVFTDTEGDFNGGSLTLSGLLAEDTVSVRNEGTGAGQIGLTGANVTYGGVVIGTLAGGAGGTLIITFNAAATSAAIDALIQNLTYANSSDTPTASRDLTINVTDAAGNDLPPLFTPRTGTANPFNGVDVGGASSLTFADVDGDGDFDAVVGESFGTLLYYENTGTALAPVFTPRTGTANPFNGVDVGLYSAPTFGDLDGDGDLDALVGERDGVLNYYENTGTASAPVFVQQTGADNPFNGVDVGLHSTPTFADLDGDGDLDALIGEWGGTLRYYENTGTASAPVFTPRTGTANPFDGVDVGFNSAPTFADLDGDGDLDAMVGERYGALRYYENTGTALAPVFTPRTGTANPFNGTDVGSFSTPTFADLDDDGDLNVLVGELDGVLNYYGNTTIAGQTIMVTVTAQKDKSQLTGFAPSVTFGENTVNATPQLLDADVVFTDSDGDFNGGFLTLSGLLAEDTVSVRNEGSGAGQIGLSGANVTYGGVLIGTLAGGAGGTLTITFNAAATSVAIDALIQNLTYANSSDTPTASRDLTLNVTDAAGNDLSGAPAFTLQAGAANPFDGVDLGSSSRPTFADLDGDGDLDAMFGEYDGVLNYFENTGSALAPVFTQRTGTANPFDGVDVGQRSAPAFADLDGDGDLDALVGENDGTLNYFENTGSALAPVFTQRTGTANPFNGVDVGLISSPTFVDLDDDGDLDAMVGGSDGVLNYFENTGTALAPVFTPRTGTANPFNGVYVGGSVNLTFADVDRDGDFDAVVGEGNGFLYYFENTGTASAPVFVQRTGTANPLDGVDLGFHSFPTFADLDGDGDPDVVVGEFDGVLNYFENATVPPPSISVTVTAEDDIVTINGTSQNDTLTGTAGADEISGRGGNDMLAGGNGDDRLDGGKGVDMLDGGMGDDRLDGGADNDRLDGGVGNDILKGGTGNDVLIGGAGDDTMDSGPGNDIFLFNAGLFGADRIVDFGNGSDKIQFSGIAGVTSFANLVITAVSGGVLITLPDGSTITIAGMNVAQTDASDFIFGP